MNKDINNCVKVIIDTIKFFDWNIRKIWVENNCIYAERIRKNNERIIEGLYAGAEDTPQNVYDVCNRLKYVMNFNNMLNNDNIMI